MKTDLIVPLKGSPTVIGDRPIHRHKCPEAHEWDCNSPYCEFLAILCPGHGGRQPFEQGAEPWRR